MKRFQMLGVCAFLVLATLLTGCGGPKRVIIGSKSFTENIILGEIMAQLIENHSDIEVGRKFHLGDTFVTFEAMEKGDIDIYPEYTGTALTVQLKKDIIKDPDEVYSIVKEEFSKQFGITWLKPFGVNNTYAIGVHKDLAAEYGLEKCSDLAAVGNELVFGAEPEFFNRQDGYDGFIEVYGITFKEVIQMMTSLKYKAIGEGKMDVTDPFATDGDIIQFKLKILEDDKGFFPPYFAAPIVKNEVLKKYPELEKILDMLEGQISNEEMTWLNYQASAERKEIKEIAKEFLQSKGLLE